MKKNICILVLIAIFLQINISIFEFLGNINSQFLEEDVDENIDQDDFLYKELKFPNPIHAYQYIFLIPIPMNDQNLIKLIFHPPIKIT